MHCDMLKIQDGGAIVEKLNCKIWSRNFVKCVKYSPVKFANFVYIFVLRAG